VYDVIPYQVKQRAGDRGITVENMEKSQHTDFNEDTTNESVNVACSNMRKEGTVRHRQSKEASILQALPRGNKGVA